MNLNDLRKKIDIIDKRLVELFNSRSELSRKIGRDKEKAGKNIYSPEREKEVFRRVKSFNKGSVSDETLEAIYREIMSGSLMLENFPSVAYLGMEGSFTYMAARKKFGAQTVYSPCSSILEVFQKVEHDECGYGVVPIENSIEGAVTHTCDLLVASDLKICSEEMLKISHNLLSKTDLRGIKKVYSNPNALGQCRNWLLQNLPKAKQIWLSSTTESAEKAAREKNSAAVASVAAAKIYKLNIIKRNIQDIAHNTTRFLIIGSQDVPPTGKDRTSILFSIKDKVGALYAMLQPFYDNNINLTKIESRPSKKQAWDYYFFVDFEGHRQDKNVKKALDKLSSMCKFLKVLGSYPVKE